MKTFLYLQDQEIVNIVQWWMLVNQIEDTLTSLPAKCHLEEGKYFMFHDSYYIDKFYGYNYKVKLMVVCMTMGGGVEGAEVILEVK